MGIVPDRFIRLNNSEEAITTALNKNISDANPNLAGSDLATLVEGGVADWYNNDYEVCTTFDKHIYNYDIEGKENQEVINDLSRMLKVRFRANAPRRAPNVVLVGAPGSGRTT